MHRLAVGALQRSPSPVCVVVCSVPATCCLSSNSCSSQLAGMAARQGPAAACAGQAAACCRGRAVQPACLPACSPALLSGRCQARGPFQGPPQGVSCTYACQVAAPGRNQVDSKLHVFVATTLHTSHTHQQCWVVPSGFEKPARGPQHVQACRCCSLVLLARSWCGAFPGFVAARGG